MRLRFGKWLRAIPARDSIDRQVMLLVQALLLGVLVTLGLAIGLNVVLFGAAALTLRGLGPNLAVLLLVALALALLRRGHFHWSVGLVTAVHGLFQHSNIQLRFGPLNWLFSMAELHRWHHSRTLAEANSNFGQTISVWDWVFGTRYLPRDRAPPADIGLMGLPRFPATWLAQLAAPFRWRRVKRESAGS